MSIKIMSMVWDDHSGNLTGVEKSILLRLADFAADNGSQIFPSLTTVAEDSGFSRMTVIRSLQSLEKKKYIRKTNRQKNVQNITNLYKIDVEKLRKGGSNTELPGVVTQSYQGSIRELPDPSIDPSHRSINNKPPKKINKKPPTCETIKTDSLKSTPSDNLLPNGELVDVVLLNKFLEENGCLYKKNILSQLLKNHGEKSIRDAVLILNTQKDIRNPSGWLKNFLLGTFKIEMVPKHHSSSKNLVETKNLISKIDNDLDKSNQDKQAWIEKFGRLPNAKEMMALSQKSSQ